MLNIAHLIIFSPSTSGPKRHDRTIHLVLLGHLRALEDILQLEGQLDREQRIHDLGHHLGHPRHPRSSLLSTLAGNIKSFLFQKEKK